jgi:glutamyl-tRNA reductase
MQLQFKYIGASYQKAELSLRESISLNEVESQELMQSIKDFCGVTEMLIISTCNRTGIYYTHELDLSEPILKLLGLKKGISNILSQRESFVSITDHKEAIHQLYRVSMGLESQVIGDLQISNQFKKAYQQSADLEMCGPFVHRLMHSIFFTNKKVAQETAYRDGTASVSYASVELINDFATNFKDSKVLVIGLGEMGLDVAKNLREVNYSVTLCNRTREVAEELAAELDYDVLDFEDLKSSVSQYDIILSAAQVSEPLITKSDFEGARFGLKYLIDLGMPRSIDAEIAKIPGTLLYNIDNIRNQTEETIQKRLAAVPHVESLVQDALAEFDNWEQEMEVSPTINKLKNALEDIRKEEIARYLKNLDADKLEVIENITKGMMQKIIKLPVMQLKAACKRGEAETLIDVLNDLFNLEGDKVESK